MHFKIKRSQLQAMRLTVRTNIAMQGRSVKGYPGDWVLLVDGGQVAILPDPVFKEFCEPLDEEASQEYSKTYEPQEEYEFTPEMGKFTKGNPASTAEKARTCKIYKNE